MRRDLILYWVCIVGFLTYKIIEIYYPDIPLVHCYFEDFIALPIMLKSAQLIIQFILPKQFKYCLKWSDVFLICIGVAAYFEIYLPRVDPRFTADWYDAVAYVSGAFVFYFFMNKALPLTSQQLFGISWKRLDKFLRFYASDEGFELAR